MATTWIGQPVLLFEKSLQRVQVWLGNNTAGAQTGAFPSRHRSRYGTPAEHDTSATLMGCGDEYKAPREAGAADMPGDVTASPDFGAILYKCTNPGKAYNAHNACTINPICE